MVPDNERYGDDGEKKIKEVLPWGSSDFLLQAIEEKKREKSEAIEIIESLVDPDSLPDDVKPLVKKPKKEELIEDDDDDIAL
ncbi:hypothetical protein CL1_2009 [Thermococcus cleftensis]|uniref:Uncharacterized protein n=1 Tax=Thermococcus cleftensis (strain DSM 27260 / KACC 17922 / CL1) TaxID=163003 RepID=I3ZWW9_THECF|nr:hypothetical protein [Thermococcus cleftensis]AFL96203.1 hypothetical protein CL1_2009 [Thermococcus cleftensis]